MKNIIRHQLTRGSKNPIAVKNPKFAIASRINAFELDSSASINCCKIGKRDERDKYRKIPAKAAKKNSLT